MKRMMILITLVVAIPSLIFAADRLTIQDGSNNTTFKVEDTGAMTIDGTDTNNDFQLKVLGKANGETHTQIITDDANSRLTILASSADDFAPRLQMIGPGDAAASKGTALFDFGSDLVDLPDAQFRVRHVNPTDVVDMIRIFGRDGVYFPKADVTVGIRTSSTNFPLQVGNATCDGEAWIDSSSRELKENIAELNREEAFETLRQMTPVTYSYKSDASHETNVGFIAEDVPELVATQDRKGMVSMEVVAVLTKVVQEQQEMITKLNAEVQSLKDRM